MHTLLGNRQAGFRLGFIATHSAKAYDSPDIRHKDPGAGARHSGRQPAQPGRYRDAGAATGRAIKKPSNCRPSDPERLRSRLLGIGCCSPADKPTGLVGKSTICSKTCGVSGPRFPEDLAGAWRIRSAVAIAEGIPAGRFPPPLRRADRRVTAWIAPQSVRSRSGRSLLCVQLGRPAGTGAENRRAGCEAGARGLCQP